MYYIKFHYLGDSLQMTYLKKVLEKHIYRIIHCNIVLIIFNFEIEYHFGISQE